MQFCEEMDKDMPHAEFLTGSSTKSSAQSDRGWYAGDIIFRMAVLSKALPLCVAVDLQTLHLCEVSVAISVCTQRVYDCKTCHTPQVSASSSSLCL